MIKVELTFETMEQYEKFSSKVAGQPHVAIEQYPEAREVDNELVLCSQCHNPIIGKKLKSISLKGRFYCSEPCYQKAYRETFKQDKHCPGCGKLITGEDEPFKEEGEFYCSQHCFVDFVNSGRKLARDKATAPKCEYCNEPMPHKVYKHKGKGFCSKKHIAAYIARQKKLIILKQWVLSKISVPSVTGSCLFWLFFRLSL